MMSTIPLVSRLYRIDAQCYGGFAVDPDDPTRKFCVEVFVDGLRIAAAIADLFSDAAQELGLGDGCHGFVFNLAPTLFEGASQIEVRLANLSTPVGAPLLLSETANVVAEAEACGDVVWSGGLKFTGWTPDEGEEAPWVGAYLDGETIAETRANRWRHSDRPRVAARRGFEIHLPPRFADGRVWRVGFKTGDGRELSGSPVCFCAFERGLEESLSRLGATPGQKLQGQIFDRLLPSSLPFSLYDLQKDAFRPQPPAASGIQIGVLALDGEGLDATLASLWLQTHGAWTCGVLPGAGDAFSFETTELADFVLTHAGDVKWFLFVMPGVVLDEAALARFAEAIQHSPDAPLIYGDFEMTDEDGAAWPIALPAFDYERLLEQGYFCAAFLAPRRHVEAAIGKSVRNFFRMANVVFDDAAGGEPLHLPGPVARLPQGLFSGAGAALREATQAHLAARGVSAEATDLSDAATPICRVKRRFARKPRVSILIPTRNRKDLLAACLEFIYDAAARARSEIIVIDNDSSDPTTQSYLRKIAQDGVRVMPAPGAFNYSRINNLAALEARGDFLCFLNNDIVALDNGWLEEMLSRHVDDRVGAVGAKLLWPSKVVQHGGVTLGVNFAPIHAFRDRIDDDPGYAGLLRVAHCCAAVTAACMTTPRALFLEAKGFDEIRFPVNFNDVDYCLKLGALGRSVILTPHARLIHKESVSRGRDVTADASGRLQRELRNLREKWGEALINDPFYSPLLALNDPPYSALAWPPRSLRPRTRLVAPPRSIPAGF